MSVFLCSNLGTAPAGTQECLAPPARLTATFGPEQVVGPTDQGIEPGEFDELIAATRAQVTYANVHSSTFPNGEIRGQRRPMNARTIGIVAFVIAVVVSIILLVRRRAGDG